MPGLIACGRRWNLGSDDLIFPFLIDFFIRFAWFVPLSVIFAQDKNTSRSFYHFINDSDQFTEEVNYSCADGQWLLQLYLVVLQSVLVFQLLINLVIIGISLRGTVIYSYPRRHVYYALFIRCVLFGLEIFWHALSSYWLWVTPVSCQTPISNSLTWYSTLFGWILMVLSVFITYTLFDPSGSRKHFRPSEFLNADDIHKDVRRVFLSSTDKGEKKFNKSWKRKVTITCCCLSLDRASGDAYREVASVMSSYFQDIDVVLSDLGCGTVLLRRQQKQLKAKTGHTNPFPPKVPLTPYTVHGADAYAVVRCPRLMQTTINMDIMQSVFTDECSGDNWMTPTNALYYMRFAKGAYSWPAFCFRNVCTGLCRIWPDIKCFSCFRESRSDIVGDNCWGCYAAALPQMARLDPEDIVFMSFDNDVYEVPFYVAYDHETRNVVLVIRGTLSLGDILTDLSGDPCIFTAPDVPSGSVCHIGMHKCANFVSKTMRDHEVLERAFADHQEYGLIITGHSLGGGVAVLLSFMLRPIYPHLRCFAYSPPGVVDAKLAKMAETFVFSVVLGDDLIPRINHCTLEDFKRKILQSLLENKERKISLLWEGFLGVFFKSKTTNPLSAGISEKQTAEEMENQLNACNALISATLPNTNITIDDVITRGIDTSKSRAALVAAGRILYMIQKPQEKELGLWWTTGEYFDHIIISPNMLVDHLPDRIYRALQQAKIQTTPPVKL